MTPTRPSRRRSFTVFLLGVTFVFLFQGIRDEDLIRRLELMSLDQRYRLLHRVRQTLPGAGMVHATRSAPEIVVVEIDDEAIARAPERLPPGRRRQADLIDLLTLSGSRIIGMDFSIHGRSEVAADDEALKEAIRRSGRTIYGKQWMARDGQWWSVPNSGWFAEVMRAEGSVVVEHDADDRVRRFPLYSLEEGRFLPSFALVILIHHQDLKNHQVIAGGGELVLDPPGGPARHVALDARHAMLLDLAIPEYPYRRVRYGELEAALAREPDLLRDRIVLVGSTARGSHDYHPVPIGPRDPGTLAPAATLPGVHLHALAVHHLLTGSGLHPLDTGVERALLPALGLAASGVAAWCGLQTGLVVLVTTQLVLLVGGVLAFLVAGTWMPLVLPELMLLLITSLALGHHFLREREDRRSAEALIEGFLSPKHLVGLSTDDSETAEQDGALMAARERLAPPGYAITGKLGQGGMAVVFRATQESVGRPVALKLISPNALQKKRNRERFRKEAQLAGSLVHPNLVAVFDSGESHGVPYIVMEFVDGVDLRTLIERGGRMHPLTAVTFLKELLTGLSAIHAQGIVHRDIKSANVLVSRTGEVKITDFGIARSRYGEALETTQGMLMGTPAYVAPELIHGQPPGRASDLYSLGIVLYEMLTGSTPFRGDSIAAILKKQLADPVPDPAGAGVDLPPVLAEVLDRLLEKEPQDRFEDADSVLLAIADLVPEGAPEVLRAAVEALAGEPGEKPAARGSEDTTIPVE